MKPHIIVCIKSVVLETPRGPVVRQSDNCVINPFDKPAIEAALRLKEKTGGSVTVLSMGPMSGKTALLEALAMGADRAVLVCDPRLAGSDTLATSTLLAAAVTALSPFDFIFFGIRTADSDTGQVGPQASVLLELPLVTGVYEMELNADVLTVKRKSDGFLEAYTLAGPAVITVDPSAATPRDMGLAGLETAFESNAVEIWDLDRLNVAPDQVGDEGSPTRVLSMTRVKKKRSCDFIEGETAAQADELIKRLVDAGLIG